MRQKIVAGNWKMNKNFQESKTLASDILKNIKKSNGVRVMIAPATVNLSGVQSVVGNDKIITVAAQNVHQADSGAYTGEISTEMLASIGVKTTLIGHSERRSYFGEDDKILKEKANKVLAAGFEIVYCFGEVLEDRKYGRHFDVVKSQLKNVLFDLPESSWKNIILAYEPVWAIGTGETATAKQAQEMHAFIRKTLADFYNTTVAESVSILYGGSCKPTNASEIFAGKDVDGGLIGGASLQLEDFIAIIEAL